MKEYWVNVYTLNSFVGFNKWIERPNIMKDYNFGKVKYRLHVREFDTKEAKELYLAYKYNRPKTGSMIEQHRKMVMNKEWSIWE